ncbi:helix-turn-helix domain-containing protein [Paeniclostridium sordellii]|nr:helix-turn-helix domain-containing protein [Paeniclostridium sordellii]
MKKLRKEKSLSQEQLAEMLNVSRQAVSKVEIVRFLIKFSYNE